MGESIIYYSIKIFGVFIRLLPVSVALWIGRVIGLTAYYFDVKHKSLVFGNLKIAFASSKSPKEIRGISKQLFKNYGQNLIELLRLPLLNPKNFHEYISIEGKEHVQEALKEGKGLILLPMHFGSWELANLSFAMMDHPYKVIVKPQKRFSKLDDLLNSYRACGGSVVLERGFGTREFIRSLRNNEIVGMVADQGGKTGTLVPFFGRQASMSVGAMRMGLKFGVPICFAIILREKGPKHRVVIHKPFDLENTGDVEKDIKVNLGKVTKMMEDYIRERPAEYMWFYKIWKYSKESVTVILHDGKTGHLRQSESVAKMVSEALGERRISSEIKIIEVMFKSKLASRIMAVLSVFANNYIFQGRLGFMKWFLTKESFEQIMSVKADFMVSCGSSTAAVNYLLSNDQQAKSLVVLKPGLLNYGRFDCVVLPQHDRPRRIKADQNIVITKGAPNLITREYLEQQTELLLNRFSHLKIRDKLAIGFLLGGNTRDYILEEQRIRMVIHQIKEVAEGINADIFVTTSRRTPVLIENMVYRELKKHPRCPLLISAKRNNVPEAIGGILGLSDVVVVSGDSISMISEAAASGKKTVVFSVQEKFGFPLGRKSKHSRFIEMLNDEGYILSANPKGIRQAIYDLVKNKIQTHVLDDNDVILDGVREII